MVLFVAPLSLNIFKDLGAIGVLQLSVLVVVDETPVRTYSASVMTFVSHHPILHSPNGRSGMAMFSAMYVVTDSQLMLSLIVISDLSSHLTHVVGMSNVTSPYMA